MIFGAVGVGLGRSGCRPSIIYLTVNVIESTFLTFTFCNFTYF
jgi:hypothetical protein